MAWGWDKFPQAVNWDSNIGNQNKNTSCCGKDEQSFLSAWIQEWNKTEEECWNGWELLFWTPTIFNTLVCWADGTNESSTNRLTFQVFFFFIMFYNLRALKTLYSHFCNFIKKNKKNWKVFFKQFCEPGYYIVDWRIFVVSSRNTYYNLENQPWKCLSDWGMLLNETCFYSDMMHTVLELDNAVLDIPLLF